MTNKLVLTSQASVKSNEATSSNATSTSSSSTPPTTTTTSVILDGPPSPAQRYQPKKLDVWLLGIAIVLGGQYSGWNTGLSTGVCGYFIAFFVMSAAYVVFGCCVAEIAGVLPFAGGSYGLARCTMGFFAGFVIGCFEALEYIAACATAIISVGYLIVQMAPDLQGFEPLIWFLCYLIALASQIRGDAAFWVVNKVLALASLGLLVLYGVGGLPLIDYKANVAMYRDHQYFVHGARGVLQALPSAAWLYTGIQNLNLASNDVQAPTTIIPIAIVRCVLTLFATGALTVIVTIGLPIDGGPVATADALAPLNAGFQLLLGNSPNLSTILSLPATYGVAFGCMWSYGKLLHSMAKSKLLPSVLAVTTTEYETNYAALLAGSLAGYMVCLVVYVDNTVAPIVFYITLLAEFVSYTGQCIGYIVLRLYFPHLKKKGTFSSPFGVYGAVFAMVVWLVGIVSICASQPQSPHVVKTFGIGMLMIILVYLVYARRRQILSPEERRVLMVAHIAKRNHHPHHRHKRHKCLSSIAQCDSVIPFNGQESVRTIGGAATFTSRAQSCQNVLTANTNEITPDPSPNATSIAQ